ncbi:BQ2448_6773 [Microbotryum intermedium]|uniref:BQ2448_6773 protein n=1 Tax=Microbotryum intermedium TaxID=269621 RepID=A0A238FQ60_9BASI|nr:BQ2448_6773 [Microbotryum intermedium]
MPSAASSEASTSTSTTTSTSTSTSGHVPVRRHLRTSSSSSSLLSASAITANGSLARPILTSTRRCSSNPRWSTEREPSLSELILVEQRRLQREQLRRTSSAIALGGDRSASATHVGSLHARRTNGSLKARDGDHHRDREGSYNDQDGDDHDNYDVVVDDDDDDDDDDEAKRDWRDMMEWRNDLPQSAILYPPLYGRPGPQPSPDLFTTLLQPLLSLSRPPSPSPAPPSIHSSPTILVDDHATSTKTTRATSSPATLTLPTSTLAPSSTTKSTSTEIPDRSASSLPAQFPPRASTDPGPTVESQGFVLYIGSGVAWIMYLVWSLVPDRHLEAIGIAWYPSRSVPLPPSLLCNTSKKKPYSNHSTTTLSYSEWSLLVPAWTIMLAAFIYFSYLSINLFITPPINSFDTLTDPFAFILVPTEHDPHPLIANSILLPPDAVPPIHDLPVALVNRVVFGDFRRKEGGTTGRGVEAGMRKAGEVG